MGETRRQHTWNHRMVVHENGTTAVHEVHYTDGVPHSWTEDPVRLGFFDDLRDLRDEVSVVSRVIATKPLYIVNGKIVAQPPAEVSSS